MPKPKPTNPAPHDRRPSTPFGKRSGAQGQLPHTPINTPTRTLEIPDPYDPATRIAATQSLRDDPLARLHARNQIDYPQYLAGRHVQALHEAAELAPIRSVDTTLTPVDASRSTNLLSERQRKAQRHLNALHARLGHNDYALLHDVLARRLFIHQIAAARLPHPNERDTKYLGRRFRDALETAAKFFGYA